MTTNIDGKVDDNESGSSAATLFIDKNGNFQLDDNETSFKPSDDGKFSQIVPPGQYSLCIKPDNPDANVTYPIEEHKAYLTLGRFRAILQAYVFWNSRQILKEIAHPKAVLKTIPILKESRKMKKTKRQKLPQLKK